MKTICEFPISKPETRFKLSMPKDAEVLSVQQVKGIPTIFALVDMHNEENKVDRHFYFVSTDGGFEPVGLSMFIGTIQVEAWTRDPLVFHLFEERLQQALRLVKG